MKSRLAATLMGVLILIIGGFFLIMLGNQLKLESELGKYWPVLLIFIGLIALGSAKDHYGFPLGLIGLGLVLTLGRLGVFKSANYLEPILIVLVGILVLALASSKPSKPHSSSDKQSHDRVVE